MAEWFARSEKETTMQNVEQKNSENHMLTDAELEAINGGSIFGWIVKHVHDLFAGNGDLRRSTDPPELTSCSRPAPAARAAIAGVRPRLFADTGATSSRRV